MLEYGKDLKRQVIMYIGNARGHGGKENGSSNGQNAGGSRIWSRRGDAEDITLNGRGQPGSAPDPRRDPVVEKSGERTAVCCVASKASGGLQLVGSGQGCSTGREICGSIRGAAEGCSGAAKCERGRSSQDGNRDG